MKRLVLVAFILLLVLLAGAVWLSVQPPGASDADAQTMRVAGELYDNGQYAQAAQMLEQLVERGVVNADLYYNLGTAYLQAGDMGRAVANLRRAAQLAPRDRDIAANLTVALTRSDLPPALPADSWTDGVVRAVETRLTMNETAALAVGLWLAFFLVWLLIRRATTGTMRGVRRLALIVTLLLAVIGTAAFGMRLNQANTRPLAVSLADNTQVYDAAGRNMAGVLLRGGEAVEVVDRREGWLFVRRATGLFGWVREGTVEVV